MRVPDLGCGQASSSIFLRREFGVEVGDGFVVQRFGKYPSDPRRRRRDGVFPVRADARSCRSPRNSSMPSCRSTRSSITGPTICTELPRPIPTVVCWEWRGRTDARDRRGSSGASARVVDAGPLVSAFAAWWRRHWDRTGMWPLVADVLDGFDACRRGGDGHRRGARDGVGAVAASRAALARSQRSHPAAGRGLDRDHRVGARAVHEQAAAPRGVTA